ncbi:peptidoglycan hydrolase-like protein with peptidoglycan-binding domain [Streptosporangium album]|uniref:Peptidoglycan hydrolase-like protein with peptidoglycan-binding domain n=1 Tax=Streptosporangium album TaxID=47479 RepID=A0A7W7RSV0_9ACTN|nr:peptidoglycan-binding protein [Streptosporangium album]MBB4937580.1 peptidoglycan hydrolase-like protein with peptidoglycan-binding domain [Streptosporangium album]
MTSRQRVLSGIVAGVVVIAGAGWAVGTRLRSPADEAASRRPPRPSLVTSPVVRKKLTSTVAVSGTLAYGSPLPVTLAGVVGGTAENQRVTRAPRPGKITEGSVLMEVNGRPVFALRGKVPMHRTMAAGTAGADVKQLQTALRRLGFGAPVTGVFDSATTVAVQRWYAKRGYVAQEPDLTAKQTREQLRQAVQTAEETLLTDRKALDAGRDVKPLKLKLDNARQDLRAAENALEGEDATDLTPEETRQLETLRQAVRTAEEEVLAAEQALAAAQSPPAPPTPKPEQTPAPAKPEADTRLLETKVYNARQNLESAHAALAAFADEAGLNKGKRLAELRKAVRLAKEAVVTAEQALRQARQDSPLRLKIANGSKNVASAKAILAEYLKTYGIGIPPGEIAFLPALPARLDKASVKPGDTVGDKVATVTSSAFAVTGSVETKEAKLLRKGMKATLETADGTTFRAVLSATGEAAKPADEEKKDEGAGAADDNLGSVPVLLTPTVTKGLREQIGASVTVKISVGATGGAVLTVPVAAVVTSADGRPRVQVELPGGGDKVKDVEVKTGLTADGDVEVTPVKPDGLKEGDRVVVSGDA